MKRILATVLFSGSVIAGTVMTASPASAACYNYEAHLAVHIPTVCVGYDYCDADICIDYPKLDPK